MLILGGCTQIDRRMEEAILQKSEIPADAGYLRYQRWKADGKLDRDGYYNGTEGESVCGAENNPLQKQVHVTFAENCFLRVRYYYDAACSEPVDPADCYLNPGECIYAPPPECENPYSNRYMFAGFRICEYTDEGSRAGELQRSGGGNLVLEVPRGYTGRELSVEPLGEYRERMLSFTAYCVDADGTQREIPAFSGTWLVNGETCQGGTAAINPSISYRVSYQYDRELYYYAASVPRCFSYDDEAGVAAFAEATAFDDCERYSLELRRYLTAVFTCDFSCSLFGRKAVRSIRINDAERKLQDNMIGRLKSGDVITIEIAHNYRLLCESFAVPPPESVEDQKRYTITIPETYGATLSFRICETDGKEGRLWRWLTGLQN